MSSKVDLLRGAYALDTCILFMREHRLYGCMLSMIMDVYHQTVRFM